MLSSHRSPDISLEILSGWIQDILLGINDLKKVMSLMSTTITTLQSAIDQLQADVAAETGANQSAIALIQGFSTQLQAIIAQGDTPAQQVALVALDQSLQANAAALAAAVAANPLPTAPGASGASGS